jgi:hypothetical protein
MLGNITQFVGLGQILWNDLGNGNKDETKEDEIGVACRTYGRGEKCIQNSGRKT